MNKLINIIMLIRPHYWSKNLIIFVPFFANKNESFEIFINLLVGLFIFCLVSSIGYIFNDISDVKNDKKHLYKKNRPIANNSINIKEALTLIFLLLLITVLLLYIFSNIYFSSIILIYLIGTFIYSVIVKKIFLLDIILISIFFILRIEAGSAIIKVDSSIWLISYSLLFFLSLSSLKRIAEVINFNELDEISFLRKNYTGNTLLPLIILSIVCHFISCIILYNYINSDKVLSLYNEHIYLYLTIPLLTIWYSLLTFRIIKYKINVDPIVFTLKDKFSYIILTLIILIVYISY